MVKCRPWNNFSNISGRYCNRYCSGHDVARRFESTKVFGKRASQKFSQRPTPVLAHLISLHHETATFIPGLQNFLDIESKPLYSYAIEFHNRNWHTNFFQHGRPVLNQTPTTTYMNHKNRRAQISPIRLNLKPTWPDLSGQDLMLDATLFLFPWRLEF